MIRLRQRGTTLALTLAIVLGAGAYGFAIGLWRSPLQAGYVAIKMPILVAATLVVNAMINGMLAQILGSGLTFRQTFKACWLSFAIFGLIVGGLSPIAVAMTLDMPSPTTQEGESWYRALLLTHTVIIATAGIVANKRLLLLLRHYANDHVIGFRTLIAWLTGNLFVGAQLSYNLRPFFGNPKWPVEFLRPDPFDGSFYEVVWDMLEAICGQMDLPSAIHKLIFFSGSVIGCLFPIVIIIAIAKWLTSLVAPNKSPQQPPIMNPTDPTQTSTAATPSSSTAIRPMALAPFDGPITFFSVLENLLRAPGRVLHECSKSKKVPIILAIGSLICITIFGLLLGTFSGGDQLWAAPAKVGVGIAIAVLICLPSLLIFSTLAGVDAKLVEVVTLLLSVVALTSVLLLGFAPIVWIFSQSTNSIAFMGALTILFWFIALSLGLRLITHLSVSLGAKSEGFLKVWMFIFFIVTLQMSTALRPLIGKADTYLPTEKKFFIEHWIDSLGGGKSNAAD
jgi:hypothetical protein